MCDIGQSIYVTRGHYPDMLPISPRTSECRSNRRPNPRVILSNPKGEPWGSLQTGNLFLMSLLIPSFVNDVDCPRLMVVCIRQQDPLEDLVQLDKNESFPILDTLFARMSFLRSLDSEISLPIYSIGNNSCCFCASFGSFATYEKCPIRFMKNAIISRFVSVICNGRFRYWTAPSSESARCVCTLSATNVAYALSLL